MPGPAMSIGLGPEKRSARRDVAARAQFLTVNFHHRTKDEHVVSSSFLIFCADAFSSDLHTSCRNFIARLVLN